MQILKSIFIFVFNFIIKRVVPNLTFINLLLLIFFGLCLFMIHNLVDKPYLLSPLKVLNFGLQQVLYRTFLNILSAFNLWLVFYPICRTIYLYREILKIELKDLSFDLLILFNSLIFTYVIVYSVYAVDSYLFLLNMHLALEANSPDVNLFFHVRNLLLTDYVDLSRLDCGCTTCKPESTSDVNGSSGDASGGSSSSKESPKIIATSATDPPASSSDGKSVSSEKRTAVLGEKDTGLITKDSAGNPIICTKVCEVLKAAYKATVDAAMPEPSVLKDATLKGADLLCGAIKENAVECTGANKDVKVFAAYENPKDIDGSIEYHKREIEKLEKKKYR